ncbi:hypothetical protein, partial [Niallia circulans]|uniref:hypothetical protein n=1 Tax=Niallia circulans TaxID=1397 RepID=UPI001C264443
IYSMNSQEIVIKNNWCVLGSLILICSILVDILVDKCSVYSFKVDIWIHDEKYTKEKQLRK